MPKHKPIKFQSTLEANLISQVKRMARENKKAKTIFNATLALAVMGGVLTFGPMAPGVLAGLTHFIAGRKKEKYEEYRQIWRSFNDLKKKGNLEFVKEEDDYLIYRVSKKGREKVKKLIFDELRIKIPKKWDKKWRLVIFDIPESRRKSRLALLKKLKEIGFYQCQKSVWLHPFPCMEEIEFIKSVFNIKPFVKLFLVEEMTDGKVLYHFSNQIKKVLI